MAHEQITSRPFRRRGFAPLASSPQLGWRRCHDRDTAAVSALGPLDPERGELLRRVVEGLEPARCNGCPGFAAGVAYARTPAVAVADPPSLTASAPRGAPGEPGARLAVVYGSQTGNGRRIAEGSGGGRGGRPRRARVRGADYPLRELAQERLLIRRRQHPGRRRSAGRRARLHRVPARQARAAAASTRVFRAGARRFELSEVLRDRPAGRRAPRRARRAAPVAARDCDLDYEPIAAPGSSNGRRQARERSARAAGWPSSRRCAVPAAPQYSSRAAVEARCSPTSASPAAAPRRTCATSRCRSRAPASRYEPGDALGVWHENPPRSWTPCSRRCGCRRRRSRVDRRAAQTPARLARRRARDHAAGAALPRRHAERAGSAELAAVLAPAEARCASCSRTGRSSTCCSAIRRSWDRRDLVAALRPLAPRLYSIASSQAPWATRRT